jgi:hypothetical protein
MRSRILRHRIGLFAAVAAVLVLATPPPSPAASRMPIGFQDDPTFRWSGSAPQGLDAAAAAHASIIRTIVDWRAIAPRRPARATNPFDRAYRLDDLDALVRNAQRRGLQVMITIWGTPAWANGGKGPNVPPKRLADLTKFARALSDRYSGRHAGYPYVGRYSIWNEPNLGIFLSPQFDSKGRIVSPRVYAGLYRAGYRGIKGGNRTALVAIGETSNQGRDHPLKGVNPSVSPATFARLLAQQKGLKFDAYATHPYPTRPSLPPTQKVRWGNVTLTQLKRFERSIDIWFHRSNIPVWITEYGYETKPAEPHGVTPAQQARYLAAVVRQLRADPRVQMFIWFIFRDSRSSLWQSGLLASSGRPKPAYRTFSTLARAIAGETETVRAGALPTISVAVPRIAFASPTGSPIDVSYLVYLGGKRIADDRAVARLQTNQSVAFRARFHPIAGKSYRLTVVAAAPQSAQTTTYNLVAQRR